MPSRSYEVCSRPWKGQANSCGKEIGDKERRICYVVKEEGMKWERNHERIEASALGPSLLWEMERGGKSQWKLRRETRHSCDAAAGGGMEDTCTCSD